MPFSPSFPLVSRTKAVLLAGLVASAPVAHADPKPSTHAEAWEATASGLFADAHILFSGQLDNAASRRETRLGLAVNLLQLQPKTDGRINEAAALLDALLAEQTEDSVGVEARYFRARLEHLHRAPANPEAAISHYECLVAEHPDHPLAGQALVKLALIRLYRAQPAAQRAEVFAALSARARSVAFASARRDLHLVLGEAALRLDLGDRAALDHFLGALDAGIQLHPVRADTLVRVGLLAAALQLPEIAARHHQLFLDEFPRDPRRLAVIQHLASLDPASHGRAP